MGWHFPEDSKNDKLGNDDLSFGIEQRIAPGAIFLATSILLFMLCKRHN